MYRICVLRERDKNKQELVMVQPYQTLHEVCLNHKIDLRHDCGGVCHCTTCHIYIVKGQQFLAEPSRRETDFLKRCSNPRHDSRLACQSLLLEGNGSIEILIPEEKEE